MKALSDNQAADYEKKVRAAIEIEVGEARERLVSQLKEINKEEEQETVETQFNAIVDEIVKVEVEHNAQRLDVYKTFSTRLETLLTKYCEELNEETPRCRNFLV